MDSRQVSEKTYVDLCERLPGCSTKLTALNTLPYESELPVNATVVGVSAAEDKSKPPLLTDQEAVPGVARETDPNIFNCAPTLILEVKTDEMETRGAWAETIDIVTLALLDLTPDASFIVTVNKDVPLEDTVGSAVICSKGIDLFPAILNPQLEE